MEGRGPLTTLSPHEARTAAALFERIFPADENGPGAEEIGAVAYVDRALVGPYRDRVGTTASGWRRLTVPRRSASVTTSPTADRKGRTP
jgi:hypothetical protein